MCFSHVTQFLLSRCGEGERFSSFVSRLLAFSPVHVPTFRAHLENGASFITDLVAAGRGKNKHNYVVLSISYMTSLIIPASGDGGEGEYSLWLIRLRMQLTHHQVLQSIRTHRHTHAHTHVHKPSCPAWLYILEFSRGTPSSLLLLSTVPSARSRSRALKACGCRVDSDFCRCREESIKQSIQTIQRWQTDEYHWKENRSLQWVLNAVYYPIKHDTERFLTNSQHSVFRIIQEETTKEPHSIYK